MGIYQTCWYNGGVVMPSTWVCVIVLQVVLIHGVRGEDGTAPCAKVLTSSPVVAMGSTVTATCVLNERCHLVAAPSVDLEWRVGGRLLPGNPVANQSHGISRLVISSFNYSRAFVTCSLKASPSQVIAGVEIRAGYPPEVPQNLSCQTNLSTLISMTCKWQPGLLKTQLMTNYTLHTEIRDSKRNYNYELPPGVHHFTIPRFDIGLFSEMKILVKAVNELGEATSASIMLEPVSAAKFDPPKIKKVEVLPGRFGCLRLGWALNPLQHWTNTLFLNLQVRFRTLDSPQWSEPTSRDRVRPSRTVDQCRLFHGTQYFAQIRVRYRESPWSEWSSSQSGVTLERAPSGHLDSWMKVSRDSTQTNVHLFWKPSKQFHANGQNVSFILSLHWSKKGKLCTTPENYCVFKLPAKEKCVFLSAVNAAGRSASTRIPIQRSKDRAVISEVTVVPQDGSLLVQWSSVTTSPLPTGFVVEWRPLLETSSSHLHFDIADVNKTRLLLTVRPQYRNLCSHCLTSLTFLNLSLSFTTMNLKSQRSMEPYKPYGISVYPRFNDGVGLPLTVKAYLSQKAPSMVPKIQIKKTWGFQVDLTWDEIPLSQRNGIIQEYKVFYWDEKKHIKILRATPDERRLTITDLSTESLYEAFLVVSTGGGSLNGSAFHFQSGAFDTVTIEIILILFGITASLMILSVLLCFWKRKRLKREFWPVVPDPANSSIKIWTSDSTQDPYLPCEREEPNPIYLSHLSFLEFPLKLNKEEDNGWMDSVEDTSDLGESISGSPGIPGYSGSNSGSVPYATVIFPQHKKPHVYVRSESTQPLLEEEDSFSPKCYQNIGAADRLPGERCFFGPNHDDDDDSPANDGGSENLWDDFPFLRALAMNDHPNE